MPFTPNPAAEANAAFDVVQPGTYKMRVITISSFTSKSGNECFKVELEYVDPSELLKLDGTPASNAGHIFDSGLVHSPADKQGRLRNFVEACGRTWGELTDEQELLQSEVEVKIKLDEYQGEQSNKVGRYLAPATV